MKSTTNILLLMARQSLLLLTLSPIIGYGQTRETVASNKSYQAVCYCVAADFTPSDILNMDRNGDLVTRVGAGTTFQRLRAQLFEEDRINRLLEWGVLRRTGDSIYRTFPILDKEMSRSVLELAQQPVPTLARAITPDLQNLQKQFARQGHPSLTFTFFFSYILDERVYQLLEERDQLHSFALHSGQRWAGELWLLEQPPQQTVESNSLSNDQASLLVGWNKQAGLQNNSLFHQRELLRELLDELTDKGKILSPTLQSMCQANGLMDATGKLLIPIIDEEKDQEIIKTAELIAEKIVSPLGALPLESIVQRGHLRSRQQALIIVYHELVWQLLEELTSQRILVAPEYYRPQAKRDRSSTGMLFVIKHKT